MAKNVYEGLFIFDSDLYAKGPEDISSQIAGVIEQLGGEVLLSRLWDERKLAYPVKGHRRGTYWLAYFRIEPDIVKDITRQFQLNDSILRFLILIVDPRLVDTLVEHAKDGYVPEPPAEGVKKSRSESAAVPFVPGIAAEEGVVPV